MDKGINNTNGFINGTGLTNGCNGLINGNSRLKIKPIRKKNKGFKILTAYFLIVIIVVSVFTSVAFVRTEPKIFNLEKAKKDVSPIIFNDSEYYLFNFDNDLKLFSENTDNIIVYLFDNNTNGEQFFNINVDYKLIIKNDIN